MKLARFIYNSLKRRDNALIDFGENSMNMSTECKNDHSSLWGLLYIYICMWVGWVYCVRICVRARVCLRKLYN